MFYLILPVTTNVTKALQVRTKKRFHINTTCKQICIPGPRIIRNVKNINFQTKSEANNDENVMNNGSQTILIHHITDKNFSFLP